MQQAPTFALLFSRACFLGICFELDDPTLQPCNIIIDSKLFLPSLFINPRKTMAYNQGGHYKMI